MLSRLVAICYVGKLCLDKLHSLYNNNLDQLNLISLENFFVSSCEVFILYSDLLYYKSCHKSRNDGDICPL